MATIWITYAWNDNESQDVDFLAQELERAGLTVKLDRWNIGAGRRLWEQIETSIVKPAESDAWVLIATQNSLQSEPCKEEFSFALGRALYARGAQFPVIGLFIGPIDNDLIPAAIKNRLYVSVTDPDWKERIKSAAEGRAPAIAVGAVEPYDLKVHANPLVGRPICIEVRPRAGTWAPFFAAVPASERGEVNTTIMIGPRGRPTLSGGLTMTGSCLSQDGKFLIVYAGNEATPTMSYYVGCDLMPSQLAFGVYNGQPQFQVMLKK